VVGNMGCVPPAPGYLEALQKITAEAGTVLIFDEVMTGFRVALGGAQALYKIQPDMTTLGKIIGGGLPCGAFGGRAEIMDLLAPVGPVYQAGTLSGNPLAMAAGIATVGELIRREDEIYSQLERVSAAVANGVAAEALAAGIPVVTDWNTAAKSDTALFGRFHRAMLEAGVWLPPSQFEAMFLGTAHGVTEVEATIRAAKGALARLGEA